MPAPVVGMSLRGNVLAASRRSPGQHGTHPFPSAQPTQVHMPDEHRDRNDREQPAAEHALRCGLRSLAGFMAVLAVSMFLPAGRLGWTRGWLFFATYLAAMVAATFYLSRTNPEVVVARSTPQQGNNRWDKALFALLAYLFVAMVALAAVDAGRFHWSAVPLWLSVAGYVLFLLGIVGHAWVLRANKFAEPRARIQTERGQKVVDTGPYAVVRHPLYTTTFFLSGGIPLALGSFWALIPAAIGVLVLVVRTALEDRMLFNGLAGYEEYANRVRCRLLPGVW